MSERILSFISIFISFLFYRKHTRHTQTHPASSQGPTESEGNSGHHSRRQLWRRRPREGERAWQRQGARAGARKGEGKGSCSQQSFCLWSWTAGADGVSISTSHRGTSILTGGLQCWRLLWLKKQGKHNRQRGEGASHSGFNFKHYQNKVLSRSARVVPLCSWIKCLYWISCAGWVEGVPPLLSSPSSISHRARPATSTDWQRMSHTQKGQSPPTTSEEDLWLCWQVS